MIIKQIKSKFLMNIFNQNTYVCISGKEAVIIDAGAELEDVKKAVKGKRVLAVLLTHIHFDHIFNIEKYISEFDCDVYIKNGAEKSFKNARENASVLIGTELKFKVPEKNIKHYTENLKLGEFKIKVISTPGHTKDSVCLLIDDDLFVGDLVFSDTIGRTDLVGGDMGEMQESLKKIKELSYKTAHTGHYVVAKKETIDSVIKNYI